MTNKEEQDLIDSFIEQRKTEEEKLTLQFAEAILEQMLLKKEIDTTIKDIKRDAKDNGVLVGKVMKAITSLKKELKTTDVERREETTFMNLLDTDVSIKNKILRLIEKN